MTPELVLRRKLTLRAHGKQVVFVKNAYERPEHVIMKALLWALYLPYYPEMGVEIAIGDRYKPDVVQLDERGYPQFWGEAGEVGEDKIRSLVKRFRGTHFVVARWHTRLDSLAEIVRDALHGVGRSAPFDLISLPDDSADRFIDDEREIHITLRDVEWLRLG